MINTSVLFYIAHQARSLTALAVKPSPSVARPSPLPRSGKRERVKGRGFKIFTARPPGAENKTDGGAPATHCPLSIAKFVRTTQQIAKMTEAAQLTDEQIRGEGGDRGCVRCHFSRQTVSPAISRRYHFPWRTLQSSRRRLPCSTRMVRRGLGWGSCNAEQTNCVTPSCVLFTRSHVHPCSQVMYVENFVQWTGALVSWA